MPVYLQCTSDQGAVIVIHCMNQLLDIPEENRWKH